MSNERWVMRDEIIPRREAPPEPSGAAGWVAVVHLLNADGFAIRGREARINVVTTFASLTTPRLILAHIAFSAVAG